jgi:hypothetical protein
MLAGCSPHDLFFPLDMFGRYGTPNLATRDCRFMSRGGRRRSTTPTALQATSRTGTSFDSARVPLREICTPRHGIEQRGLVLQKRLSATRTTTGWSKWWTTPGRVWRARTLFDDAVEVPPCRPWLYLHAANAVLPKQIIIFKLRS